jgi:hypothetical protein
MNQRIRELAEQSNLTIATSSLWEHKVQEFAELIVRECANVAANHDALDIYEEIREHFGVEE